MKTLRLIYDMLKFMVGASSEPQKRLIRAPNKPTHTKTYHKGQTFREGKCVYYNCHTRGLVRIK